MPLLPLSGKALLSTPPPAFPIIVSAPLQPTHIYAPFPGAPPPPRFAGLIRASSCKHRSLNCPKEEGQLPSAPTPLLLLGGKPRRQ